MTGDFGDIPQQIDCARAAAGECRKTGCICEGIADCFAVFKIPCFYRPGRPFQLFLDPTLRSIVEHYLRAPEDFANITPYALAQTINPDVEPPDSPPPTTWARGRRR